MDSDTPATSQDNEPATSPLSEPTTTLAEESLDDAEPTATADGDAASKDRRKWLAIAVGSALALVLLVAMLIARRDEPGPSNKNAKAACQEMTRISTEIIEGRSTSFAGQLQKVLGSSQAAANDNKDYAALAAAVKRLSEDPEVSSAEARDAVKTIAAECK